MPMLTEIVIFGLNLAVVLIALLIGMEISLWAGLLAIGVALPGLNFLIFNYDYPIVRRAVEADPHFMLALCDSGFVGRARRILGLLPASPRCRFCQVPFGGIGELLRIRPSAKNSNFCRSCFEALPEDGVEMEVGILFADIRGYTSWSECHTPTEAGETLTRFYAIADKALTSDDALVEFVGDQVMAIYMTVMPSLKKRTSEIMLAGARRLVAAIREDSQLLPVGVGLNFGVAVVGNFAKGEVKDFTAIGDVVNTAARLQNTAGAYEIVLSETVHAAVADLVPQARSTTLNLKGKADPLRAYVIPADV